MDLLLKRVHVIDQRYPFHGQVQDILIQNGVIQKIGKKLTAKPKTKIWEEQGLCVSIGWCDIGTQVGEPGFEHRETLASVSRAAAKGGYTALACFPNTDPVTDHKAAVQYIVRSSHSLPIDLYPIASISKGCEGKELAELIDLYRSGAVAFSDGQSSLENSGLLLRAMEYAKAIDALIIHRPSDRRLAANGLIHEGETSLQLGLTGIPSLSESLTVHRDAALCEYADAKLLLYNISSRESLRELKDFRKRSVNISATVSYLHLISDESKLLHFDSNYKLEPPLRSSQDMRALQRAVKKTEIDIITSHHQPIEPELKETEFFYSPAGAIGLQSCFSALHTHASESIGLDRIIHALTIGPRRAIDIDIPKIEEGELANLTLFNPTEEWQFKKQDNQSISCNSPFFGTTFKGRVKAIIHQNKIFR